MKEPKKAGAGISNHPNNSASSLLPPPRDVSPDPALAPIEIKGDLFGDDSADWESA